MNCFFFVFTEMKKKKYTYDSMLLEFMTNALHLGLNCCYLNQTTEEWLLTLHHFLFNQLKYVDIYTTYLLKCLFLSIVLSVACLFYSPCKLVCLYFSHNSRKRDRKRDAFRVTFIIKGSFAHWLWIHIMKLLALCDCIFIFINETLFLMNLLKHNTCLVQSLNWEFHCS